MRRGLSIIAAALAATVVVSRPASAQQPLYWGPGEDTAVVKGSVTGDQFADYSFAAKRGTSMDVQLNSADLSLYFNIIDRNSSVAIDVDPPPREVRSWSGTIPASGEYRIRLYLMGAARDENKTVRFTMTVKMANPAGGGGGVNDDLASMTQLDYVTGGTGEYFVDDGAGTRTVSKVRVVLQPDGRARIEVTLGGDGFIIHGTWSRGDGSEVKLNITHGFAREPLKGWGTLTLRNSREFDDVGVRFESPSQRTNHRLTFTAARG